MFVVPLELNGDKARASLDDFPMAFWYFSWGFVK